MASSHSLPSKGAGSTEFLESPFAPWFAGALVAAVTAGSLEAVKHLANEQSILVIDDDIREALNSPNFSEVMLRDVAKENGMLSLRQEGLRKVLEGVTTVEEVLKKTIVLG